MIGFDYSDVYVTACGKVCSSYRTGKIHERDCLTCQAIIDGEDQERENDEVRDRQSDRS